jgi:hypothetical protein
MFLGEKLRIKNREYILPLYLPDKAAFLMYREESTLDLPSTNAVSPRAYPKT